MSIKGTSQELYVGKKESNILTFWGDKKRIDYTELSRIDYMYASGLEGGYLEFVKPGNNIVRFEFGKRANEKILRTINLIEENNPGLEMNEHDTSGYKFYEYSLFSIITSFILGAPLGLIGLFLTWHYKKRGRLIITIAAITFWASWIIIPYLYYKFAMIELNETMNHYFDIINGLR